MYSDEINNNLSNACAAIMELKKAEECERESRIQDDKSRFVIAQKVATIMKESKFPVLNPSIGSKKYSYSLAERERSRLLSNPEEITAARLSALAIATLLKEANTSVFELRSAYKGSLLRTKRLEERERVRRIADQEESKARLLNGRQLSDAIRTDSAIIKARLIKRPRSVLPAAPSNWERGFEVGKALLSIAADQAAVAAAAAPAKANEVMHAAIDAAGPAAGAVGRAINAAPKAIHDAVDAATPAASAAAHMVNYAIDSARHTLAGYAEHAYHDATALQSRLLNKAASMKDTLVHTVQHAIIGDTPLEIRAAIIVLEEAERERRMAEIVFNSAPKVNAQRVAHLLKLAKFPTLKYANKGFKNFTWHVEEQERLRRLANKNESEIRRMNAFSLSRLITQLGWPFVIHAKGLMPIAILEEEERSRRCLDHKNQLIARLNANKLAELIKGSTFCQQEKKEFLVGHVDKLENKERRFRAKNSFAIHNAHKEAQLIADIGAPFYLQERKASSFAKEVKLQDLDRLEEAEKFNRMQNGEEQRIARKNARKLAKLVDKSQEKQLPKTTQDRQLAQEHAQDIANIISQDTSLLEESERKSRMVDKDLAKQAMLNARKVSGLINTAMRPFHGAANRSLPVSALPLPELAAPSGPVALYKRERPERPAPQSPLQQQQQQQFAAPQQQQQFAAPQQQQQQQQFAAPQQQQQQFAAPQQQQQFAAPQQQQQQFAAPQQQQQQFAAPQQQQQFAAPQQQFVAPQASLQQQQPLAAPQTFSSSTRSTTTATTFEPIVAFAPPATAAPLTKPAPIAAPAPARAPLVQERSLPSIHSTVPLQRESSMPVLSQQQRAPLYSAPAPASLARGPYGQQQQQQQQQQQAPGALFSTAQEQQKLVQNVQKLYQLEVQSAEKEQQKVLRLEGKKGGLFAKHRLQKHQAAVEKHRENAKRHQSWLNSMPSQPGMPAR